MTEARTVELRLSEGVTVGDLFRIARVAARLSVKEAATRLGLSYRTYTRIEDGTREPRAGELVAFAAITDQDELFSGSPSLASGPVLTGASPDLNP